MIAKAAEAKKAFEEVHGRCADVVLCIDDFKRDLISRLDSARASDREKAKSVNNGKHAER